MISESEYWKNDLKKNVIFFHDKLYQKRWNQSSYAALEKRIMLSCYIVRKLYESNMIPKKLFECNVSLYSYNNKGIVVDLLNSHKLDELYELEKPKKIVKPLSYVANQIIHSYTFIFTLESKNKISGLAFNSDRSKKKELYMLKPSDFIDVLSPIAECYVGRTVFKRNSNGEMVVVEVE